LKFDLLRGQMIGWFWQLKTFSSVQKKLKKTFQISFFLVPNSSCSHFLKYFLDTRDFSKVKSNCDFKVVPLPNFIFWRRGYATGSWSQRTRRKEVHLIEIFPSGAASPFVDS
jgi:hypothetical protein